MDAVVTVEGLRKTYGSVTAADDVTFAVARGEVFGMVGPNGAGKTTVLECVTGLRRPDAGTVRVLGLDPQRDRYAVRERIGVQLQAAALSEALRVGEAVALFASFYASTGDPAAALRRVGLEERRNARADALSGGQRQRLFIALARAHEPEVVLLDELTTGLDPQARRDAWALVREIRDRGATVILTTHFVEEAERLCDRVAIVDRGRIVALDTVGRLIASLGEERRVTFTGDDAVDGARLREPLAVFFTLALPPALVALFGFAFGNAPLPLEDGRGSMDHQLPAIAAWVFAMTGLFSVPMALLGRRDAGTLRRSCPRRYSARRPSTRSTTRWRSCGAPGSASRGRAWQDPRRCWRAC